MTPKERKRIINLMKDLISHARSLPDTVQLVLNMENDRL